MIANDKQTHDLITFDQKWVEKGRVKGVASGSPDNSNIKHLSTSNDDIILFYKGDSTLITIDISSMRPNEIPDFFGPPDKKGQIVPLMAAATSNGLNIAGLSSVAGEVKVCVRENGEATKYFNAAVKF